MNTHQTVLSDVTLSEYDYTWTLSRSRWAWEFLRRNPDFRASATPDYRARISNRVACHGITILRPRSDQAEAEAEHWGLAIMPDPDLNAFEANVFWRASLYPREVSVQVVPRSETEIDHIFEKTIRHCKMVHMTDLAGREYLLLKGNGRVVQVGCSGLSLLSFEPVKVKFTIDTLGGFDNTLSTIDRATKLYETDFADSDPVWSRNGLAWRNAVIALDANSAGLNYFETACVIYGEERASKAWAGDSRAMKDEMKRALQRGRDLRDGGYTQLLRSAST
jgi:hypothetical protein